MYTYKRDISVIQYETVTKDIYNINTIVLLQKLQVPYKKMYIKGIKEVRQS